MLTRFPTVLLQPLGHLSGKLRFSRAPCRCFQWRRERDSNPRYAYAYSGFRDRPIQPLSHLSAGENTRIAAAFPAGPGCSTSGGFGVKTALLCLGLSAPFASEKGLEERPALLGQRAGLHFRPVVEPQVLGHHRERPARAGLGVTRPVDQPRNAREDDRAGAHVAGLERDVDRGVVEAPALDGLRGGADRENFRVRGGILGGLHAVSPAADDPAFPDDHRSYGDLTVGGRRPRFRQGRLDEALVERGLRLPHLVGNFFSASRIRSEATSCTRGGSVAFAVWIRPVSSYPTIPADASR